MHQQVNHPVTTTNKTPIQGQGVGNEHVGVNSDKARGDNDNERKGSEEGETNDEVAEDQVNIWEYRHQYKREGTSPEDQEVESEVFKVNPTGFIYTSTRTPGTVFVIIIQL